MSADRLEGKIRNAIRIVEEEAEKGSKTVDFGEVPVMKKVAAHMAKAKTDL